MQALIKTTDCAFCMDEPKLSLMQCEEGSDGLPGGGAAFPSLSVLSSSFIFTAQTWGWY